MTTTTKNASPCKLRSGAWGARCASGTKTGDEITITTKAGKSWRAVVTRVVASGSDYVLAETRSLDPRPTSSTASAPRRKRRRWASCGYPGCSPDYCDECDGEGRYSRSW